MSGSFRHSNRSYLVYAFQSKKQENHNRAKKNKFQSIAYFFARVKNPKMELGINSTHIALL